MKEETKAKAAKLWSDVKSGLKTGFDATKKGLSKAGTAIQSYSDLSMVQIEKKQFETKRKKAYAQLGELAAKKLSAKTPEPVSAADEEVAEILKTISSYDKEIAKREKTLKAAEKEGKIPGKAAEKKDADKKASKKTTAKGKEKAASEQE